jgi:hypothetical protein
MRNVHCIVGRHQWKPGTDQDGRPFEVCTRADCGRYRYPDDGRSDYPGDDSSPPMGLPGGGQGGGASG